LPEGLLIGVHDLWAGEGRVMILLQDVLIGSIGSIPGDGVVTIAIGVADGV